MDNKLNTVTVTGADDSIKPEQLIDLQEQYPYAEFAILIGNEYAGKSRFPSNRWLEELEDITTHRFPGRLRLSGHLCGQIVKDFMLGKLTANEWNSLSMFIGGRIQINTHGVKHEWSPDLLNLVEEQNVWGTQVIFQYDKANIEALAACHAAKLNVSALYDLSHGAGVLPEKWEHPVGPGGAVLDGLLCGYAGGLSPENVSQHLDGISRAAGGAPFWIDAETHLRSSQSGKDIFDLDRVGKFLEAARPWLVNERSCRVCGCTDLNCAGCIERTGSPCYWVEDDLCSACAGSGKD